jgi:hypothetical protein
VEIVSRPQRGYQVAFRRVVYICVLGEGGKAVLGFAYNALIERVVSKAKQVFRERKSKEERGRPSSGRPLYAGVLDKEGEVVKSVLNDRDGNESDITEEDRARSSKWPPPKPYDQADEADS